MEGKIREHKGRSELQKGAMKKELLNKYNKLFIPEALETTKQRLTALFTRLRRYTREAEARRVNRMLSTEPSTVYAQWKGNKMRIDPPRGETEQYRKSIWGKEASHDTNASWLHSNLQEQEPVTITVVDMQERFSSMKS